MLFSELLFNADALNFFNLTLFTLVTLKNLADNVIHAYFFSYNIRLSHFSSYL